MSYAVQSPVAATAPPRRPLPVLLSAGLLSLMGLVGLGYAVRRLGELGLTAAGARRLSAGE